MANRERFIAVNLIEAQPGAQIRMIAEIENYVTTCIRLRGEYRRGRIGEFQDDVASDIESLANAKEMPQDFLAQANLDSQPRVHLTAHDKGIVRGKLTKAQFAISIGVNNLCCNKIGAMIRGRNFTSNAKVEQPSRNS